MTFSVSSFSVLRPLCVVATLSLILTACISGTKPQDTYTDSQGKTTVFETNREACVSACNEDDSKCLESDAAHDNSGINGPRGMFGASGECRSDLKNCLDQCRGQ